MTRFKIVAALAAAASFAVPSAAPARVPSGPTACTRVMLAVRAVPGYRHAHYPNSVCRLRRTNGPSVSSWALINRETGHRYAARVVITDDTCSIGNGMRIRCFKAFVDAWVGAKS